MGKKFQGLTKFVSGRLDTIPLVWSPDDIDLNGPTDSLVFKCGQTLHRPTYVSPATISFEIHHDEYAAIMGEVEKWCQGNL